MNNQERKECEVLAISDCNEFQRILNQYTKDGWKIESSGYDQGFWAILSKPYTGEIGKPRLT